MEMNTEESHIAIIKKSGLINDEYYSNHLGQEFSDNALEYFYNGTTQGVNPSYLFDTLYYIDKNSDVRAANVSPLVHYILSGEMEGRTPSVFVDLSYLKQQITSDIESTFLAFFYLNEVVLTLSSHPYFDVEFYLTNNPDVAEAGISPYHHFLAKGVFEGRNPRSDINISDYITLQEIDIKKEHPFRHFILFSGHPFVEEKIDFSNITVLAQDINVKDCDVIIKDQHVKEDHEVIDKIHESEIFDANYYLNFIDDIYPYDNAIEHYLAVGHDQLLDPSPFFSTKFYLLNNEDIKNSKVNCLYHYISIGEKEGRLPNPSFSPNEYVELNPDIAEHSGSLLGHYAHFGIREFRYTQKLISHLPIIKEEIFIVPDDVPAAIIFDADYYLQENEDVKKAGVAPQEHYYNIGEKEGRKPNLYFDPIFYRTLNPDIRLIDISAFDHFAEYGYYEGRQGIKPKVEKRSQIAKPLLFVGHDGIQAGSEVVLLEVIKWFYEHTNRRLKVLLLAPGPVADQYAQYADIFVLPENIVDAPELLIAFLKEEFEFVYLNTVVSGKLFNIIDEYQIKLVGSIITHIHEMEKVIAENLTSFGNLVKHSAHFISASPATTKTLIETHHLFESDITTVPAFIKIVDPDLSNLNALKNKMREEFSIPTDALVVGGCGTVYWRKGPDIFLDSARQVIQKSDNNIHFVWIGPGPDLELLKDSLTETEAKYIHFVGERTDANKAIAVADIFYMSSREDPFPLVVMESAQHCIPTICFSEATGITAFVQNDAGICLDFIDANKAAEAILKLDADRGLLEKLGKAARERVIDNYTSEIQCLNIYQTLLNNTPYKPSVSVIVPMYNHQDFIDERLQSILNQKIKDIEIIVLDDCSKDKSVDKARLYEIDFRLSVTENCKNTGSPFAQWEKGLSKSKADVIWIAEGDDACDNNFISTLLPYFDDGMVNIASGKTVIMNEEGVLNPSALEPYLDSAYPKKYKSSFIIDGYEEVNQNFGAICTLVNASGLLLRKSSIDLDILTKATCFKMCGDWLIYLANLRGGKLAYDVSTKNYFRRHSASVVNKVEGTDVYFNERYKITEFVFNHFNVTNKLVRRAFEAIDGEWARFKYKHENKQLVDLYNKEILSGKVNIQQAQKHIGLYVHGMLFSKGGIERLAADLANYFVEQGFKVTIYARRWGKGATPVYALYNNVQVKGVFDETLQEQTIPKLRKALLDDGVDVFIPMLSEWLFTPIIEATKYTGIPVIASEHNDPWKIEELWWKREERLNCFEQVDHIHLLLNKFSESLPLEAQRKISIIPNGIELPKSVMPYEKREKLIVGIGRLAEQKRFDRLIEAVSLIKEPLLINGWRVEVYGEGHLRNDLQRQIEELGVAELVSLQGVTNDISRVLNQAAINVMPSEFEGFGIALVEAMAHGLPSIAFEECNGPNEIITNKTGVLVHSVEALADELNQLIKNDKKRKIQSKNAVFASKQYEKKSVFPVWIKMINKVIGTH